MAREHVYSKWHFNSSSEKVISVKTLILLCGVAFFLFSVGGGLEMLSLTSNWF